MNINKQKKLSEKWFYELRDQFINEFESIENSKNKKKNIFKKKIWKRQPYTKKDNGGGTISIMYGDIFEKVGVNISTVYGNFSKNLKIKYRVQIQVLNFGQVEFLLLHI